MLKKNVYFSYPQKLGTNLEKFPNKNSLPERDVSFYFRAVHRRYAQNDTQYYYGLV